MTKLRPVTELKICEGCRQACEFIECKANPRAREWYCPRCHKSYDFWEEAPEPSEEKSRR